MVIWGASSARPPSCSVTDTWQFDDYARYVADRFSEADKRRRREEQFRRSAVRPSSWGRRWSKSWQGRARDPAGRDDGGGRRRAALFSPCPPAGRLSGGVAFSGRAGRFPAAADFHFWRREPGSPVGRAASGRTAGRGPAAGRGLRFGLHRPPALTAARARPWGSCPAEGLAFFLCLGSLPEERDGPSCASALCWPWLWMGGRALRLSLPQELPERLPMTRLAAASRPEPREPAAGKRMGEPCRGHPSRAGGWAFTGMKVQSVPALRSGRHRRCGACDGIFGRNMRTSILKLSISAGLHRCCAALFFCALYRETFLVPGWQGVCPWSLQAGRASIKTIKLVFS